MRILIWLSVAVLLASCCGKQKELTHEFDANEKAWLFYDNFDTITFIINGTATQKKLVVRNKAYKNIPDGKQCNCCTKTHDTPIHGGFNLCDEKDSVNLDVYPQIQIDKDQKGFNGNLFYLAYYNVDQSSQIKTVVNGTLYDSVYSYIIEGKYNSTTKPVIKRIYLSKSKGFLKFEFFNGDKWELKN
ncbi:MAG: hypothetical protein NTX03_03390 [Bacteroidetes bacterium]|nr:hypothetical protein [Bacteroidota bacterium]